MLVGIVTEIIPDSTNFALEDKNWLLFLWSNQPDCRIQFLPTKSACLIANHHRRPAPIWRGQSAQLMPQERWWTWKLVSWSRTNVEAQTVMRQIFPQRRAACKILRHGNVSWAIFQKPVFAFRLVNQSRNCPSSWNYILKTCTSSWNANWSGKDTEIRGWLSFLDQLISDALSLKSVAHRCRTSA